MPRIDLDSGKGGFHPLETSVASFRGYSKGRITAGILLGLGASLAFNWAVNQVTHHDKPRTLTPEWAAASETYRKQQKMDPLADFEIPKQTGPGKQH